MENNNIISPKKAEMTGVDKECCNHHHGGFWFIKILGGVLILIFLMAIITGLSHWGRFSNERQAFFDREGYGHMNMMDGRYDFPQSRGFSMMGRYRSDRKEFGYKSIFGTITKVEDNKISVTDNANKEQTLVTQTDTLIFSADNKQIGIKDLKTGANINFLGTLNQNNQYEVKWIQLL